MEDHIRLTGLIAVHGKCELETWYEASVIHGVAATRPAAIQLLSLHPSNSKDGAMQRKIFDNTASIWITQESMDNIMSINFSSAIGL